MSAPRLALLVSASLAVVGCQNPEAQYIATRASTSMQRNALILASSYLRERTIMPKLREAQFMQEADGRVYEQWIVEDSKGQLHPFQLSFVKGAHDNFDAGLGLAALPYLSPTRTSTTRPFRPLSRSLSSAQVFTYLRISKLHEKQFPGCALEIVEIESEDPRKEGYTEVWKARECGGKKALYKVQVGPYSEMKPAQPLGPGPILPMEPAPRAVKVTLESETK